MRKGALVEPFSFLTAARSEAGAPDRDVLRVATWLVGSFDTRAQAAADRRADAPYKHDVAFLTARAIDDPVERPWPWRRRY